MIFRLFMCLFTYDFENEAAYCVREEVRQICHTIAAKVDHDVSLSVHDPGESQWGYVTPYFEGTEEGIVDRLLIQIWRVPKNSVREKKTKKKHC